VGGFIRKALNVLDKGLLDSLYSQPLPQYHQQQYQQQQQQQHSPLPQYVHPGGYAAYGHAAQSQQQQQQQHPPPPPPYAAGATPSPVQPMGRNPFASAGGSPFHLPPPHAHPHSVSPYANGYTTPQPPYMVGVTPSPMDGDLLAVSPTAGTNPFGSISPAPAPPPAAQVHPPFSLVEPTIMWHDG
jgi:hypothetical protein